MRVFAEQNLARLAELPEVFMVRTLADLALRPTAEKIDAALASVPNCSRICLDLERVDPKNDDGKGIFSGGVWYPNNPRALSEKDIATIVGWYRAIMMKATMKYPHARWYSYNGPNHIPENYLFWQKLSAEALKLWNGAYVTLPYSSETASLSGLRAYVQKIAGIYGGVFNMDFDLVVGLFPTTAHPRWWWEAANEATARYVRHFIVNPNPPDDPDGVKAALSVVDKVKAVL